MKLFPKKHRIWLLAATSLMLFVLIQNFGKVDAPGVFAGLLILVLIALCPETQ